MPGVWGVWGASSPGTAAATVVLTASVLTAGREPMVAMVDDFSVLGTFRKPVTWVHLIRSKVEATRQLGSAQLYTGSTILRSRSAASCIIDLEAIIRSSSLPAALKVFTASVEGLVAPGKEAVVGWLGVRCLATPS